jgi:hypothetical protein
MSRCSGTAKDSETESDVAGSRWPPFLPANSSPYLFFVLIFFYFKSFFVNLG